MKKLFKIMQAMGAILLCLAGYMAYSTYQFQKHAIQTEGEITDLHYSRESSSSSGVWFPEVTFTDNNGDVFVFTSSFGSSGYSDSLGDKVGVIYQPGQEVNAKINGNGGLYFSSIFFGAFALGFLFIGWIGSRLANAGSRYRYLIQQGKPLQAKVVDVELNKSINFNGRSPWRIICQWFDAESQQVYLFKSENIYYDPSPFMHDDTFTVYVARNNFKKYYVDTSRLPKKA